MSAGRTLRATMSAGSDSHIDQRGWVSFIRNSLEEDLEDLTEIPVSIFSVPKALVQSDPELYTPQQVAIGPYHYWRQEVYEMERYKVAAAKKTQKQLKDLTIQRLVEELVELDSKVRACYHKYLNMSSEMLAWMMVVDASFLLEYLSIYAVKDGKLLKRISSRMSHLVDIAGRKSAHNAILRDMVMLENQIPLFVLRKLLEFQFQSLELADETLGCMLAGLCKEFSPFKMEEGMDALQVSHRAHLLDVLYCKIVPKTEEEEHAASEITIEIGEKKEEGGSDEKPYMKGNVRVCLGQTWTLLSKLDKGPIRSVRKMIMSKPMKLVVKLPWNILTKLPILSMLKEPIELLFSGANDEGSKNGSNKVDQPPLIEEITIPSVTELVNSGVKFAPATGNLSSISFDRKKIILHLPIVELDVNTEVLIRNLVAYEACKASGPLVFTRYTEFMNGIVDGEEDAKLLREKGIIFNHLKSDKEVAEIWNGSTKSLRLTKVPFIDKVIEDVNKYHNSRFNVKAKKFMKRYVLGSWQFLTFLAAIMMLLLTTLQAFCSVYSCKNVFGNLGNA
ncbi:unnamed protein product [Rhodiola kirilowii]